MSRGFPSMTALLGLLAVAGYQNRDKIAEMLKGGQSVTPASGQAQQPSGLGGVLSSLGSSSAGWLLGGGLSELLQRFREAGHGDKADSWVQTGPNKPITTSELAEAIGPEGLKSLSQQIGMSHDEILAKLLTCPVSPDHV